MNRRKSVFKFIGFCMILIIFLSGCTSKITETKHNANSLFDNEQKQKSNNNKNTYICKNSLTNVPKNEESKKIVWTDKIEAKTIKVPYTTPKINYNIPIYSVKSDLSNIKNYNNFNGFTKQQLQKLIKNGFVVLPSKSKYPHLKMGTIYDENEYSGIPSFITVDSVMNLYHSYFSTTLQVVEDKYLFDELTKLTSNMLNKSLSLYNDETYTTVKKEIKFNVAFFAIGNKLLTNEYGNLPIEIKSIVDEEINNILNAEGIISSPLLNHNVDYSQYKVRGHYTRSEKLQAYFKTMMWYGQIGLPLTKKEANGDEVLCEDTTAKALVMTYIAFMQNNSNNDIESWDKIYMPTSFYVGQSDDLNLFHYKDLILNVYGKEVNLNDFRNKKYHDKLLVEAKKLPSPSNQYKLSNSNDIPVGKQFRFMGQRYTFDGEIMQELIDPYERPAPSGLDISSVLGSIRARELLDTYYQPCKLWPGYEENFQRMKEKISKLKEDDWMSNMYNGWLYTITSIQQSFEDIEGAPMFMKNTSWTDKSISSALGSYAELKHDTVLYVKQPIAECGGFEYTYHHYVEPNVNVYCKLLWLTEFSTQNLKDRGLLSEEFEKTSQKIVKLLILLRDCSVKELNNEVLSDEDKTKLDTFGGLIDSIMYELLAEANGSELSCSAVISDIATVNNCPLEIGTELPNEIFVVIKDGEELFLSRGAVYGYHEFISDTRLTDEEWHTQLGVKREKYGENEGEYYIIDVGKPLPSLPSQPKWVNSFKSTQDNNVICKNKEANWE
jgi:hypothetical protein